MILHGYRWNQISVKAIKFYAGKEIVMGRTDDDMCVIPVGEPIPENLPYEFVVNGKWYVRSDRVYEQRPPKMENPNSPLIKSEVFDSKHVFPAMYHECVWLAKKGGYTYLEFNGMVFDVSTKSPTFANRMCMYSELGES